MNKASTATRQSLEFQELKPKFWQALYSIYLVHKNDNTTLEERTQILKGAIIPFGYQEDMALQIATAFISLFDSIEGGEKANDNNDASGGDSQDGGEENQDLSLVTSTNASPQINAPTYIDSSNQIEAHLSVLDIKELKTFALQDPDNRAALRLLVAFAIYARANPHPSHWIKYDRATIFFLADLQELKTSEQERLTKYLHEYYNLNMQVIGSNTPLPCFKLKWMAEQPNPFVEDTSNPLVAVGNYSPATISHLMQNTFKAAAADVTLREGTLREGTLREGEEDNLAQNTDKPEKENH